MGRPYGLLRAGFPYVKSLGMYRITNFPVSLANSNGRLYILCRQDKAFAGVLDAVRVYSVGDEEAGISFGPLGEDEGSFRWPVSIAVDQDERIYISDEALDRISVFDREGEFLHCWGTPGSRAGEIRRPAGLAFDAEDRLYVVDSMNHRVQRFTKDGQLIDGWGSHGDGEGQFDMPWGITVDELGDVYVADWRNDRVQKFTSDGEFVLAFGRSGCGDGEFNRPTDVAVDRDGDIYVCDRGNNRVQQFNEETRYIDKMLGAGTLSKAAREYMLSQAGPNRIRDGARIETERLLRQPQGILVDDEDRLCIADTDSYRIQVYQKEVIRLEPHQILPPMRSVTLLSE